MHYLITRLGQGYQAPREDPRYLLGFVDASWVDYRMVEDLAESELGRCVLQAAAEVRTRAFKGDYLYFGDGAKTSRSSAADALDLQP